MQIRSMQIQTAIIDWSTKRNLILLLSHISYALKNKFDVLQSGFDVFFDWLLLHHREMSHFLSTFIDYRVKRFMKSCKECTDALVQGIGSVCYLLTGLHPIITHTLSLNGLHMSSFCVCLRKNYNFCQALRIDRGRVEQIVWLKLKICVI